MLASSGEKWGEKIIFNNGRGPEEQEKLMMQKREGRITGAKSLSRKKG